MILQYYMDYENDALLCFSWIGFISDFKAYKNQKTQLAQAVR